MQAPSDTTSKSRAPSLATAIPAMRRLAGSLLAVALIVGCTPAELSEDTSLCDSCDTETYLRASDADLAVVECGVEAVDTGQYQVYCDILGGQGVSERRWVDLEAVDVAVTDANGGHLRIDPWYRKFDAPHLVSRTLASEESFPLRLHVTWDYGVELGSIYYFSTEVFLDSPGAEPVQVLPPYDVWEIRLDAPHVMTAGFGVGTNIHFDFPLPEEYECEEVAGEGAVYDISRIRTELDEEFGSKVVVRVPRGATNIVVEGTAEGTGLRGTYPLSLSIPGPGRYLVERDIDWGAAP